MPAEPAPAPELMQCMQIWGGNDPIERSVRMAGIDVFVFSKPWRPGDAGSRAQIADGGEAGGDIHFLSSCATGRISRLIVADVSGHGAGVAAAAASLRRLMGRFSNFIDQSRLVEAVNRRFDELQDEDARFAGLFATAIVATYFSPTDELTISNAGHPRPLRFDGERRAWEVLALPDADPGVPANLPLGVLAGSSFSQRSIPLGPRDAVLFYTDALTEARDAAGRLLGEEGLIAMLAGVDVDDGPRAIASLRAALARRSGDAGRPGVPEFDDDVTIMLLKRNSAKPRPSLVLGMAALARIARSAVGGRGLGLAIPEMGARAILGAVLDRFNRRGPAGSEPRH